MTSVTVVFKLHQVAGSKEVPPLIWWLRVDSPFILLSVERCLSVMRMTMFIEFLLYTHCRSHTKLS